MKNLGFMKNKRGDFDLGQMALYVFMASVFLTFIFLTFYGLLVNLKAETFKTKDFIEGSAIKYTLIHSKDCFASDDYEIPIIDSNKFTSEILKDCTKGIEKSVKAVLFDKGNIFRSEISNGVGGYRRRGDSALVLVNDNGKVRPMVMKLEYGA